MDPTTAMRRRASEQHALVTDRDLAALGVARGRRRGLVARGELVRLAPGVHRIGGAPPTTHQAVLAACLATDGVAAGTAAAWLHGFDGFVPGSPPSVLVRRPAPAHPVAIAEIHSTRWLPTRDVVQVQGIPSLNVARTLLSLAALVPGQMEIEALAGAVEQAVAERKASDRWLRWHLEQLRACGRNGVAAYDEVLAERAHGRVTESWLERETLIRLRDGGLPLPDCQQLVPAGDGFVARVDFTYLATDLVLEVSGYRWHRTRAQMAHDLERRRRLTLAGKRVLEYTHDDIVHRSDRMVAEVAAALHLSAAA